MRAVGRRAEDCPPYLRRIRNRAPFPDRHILFQAIHEAGQQRERLGAMLRSDADVDGRFTDGHDADAMNDFCREARMARGKFLHDPPHLALGHW